VLDPETVGSDLGALRAIYFAVGSLGPLYVGTLATHFGYTRSFASLAAYFGLAAVTLGWLGAGERPAAGRWPTGLAVRRYFFYLGSSGRCMAIVAAVDSSDRATAVLAEAATLANEFDEELHALHVLERAELVEVLEKEVEGQDPRDNYEVQQRAERIVSRALPDTTGGDPTVAVRVGDPGAEIVSYAAENDDVRYVVVGGRQRTPTGKALFGSVTQAVMLESPVSVVNVVLE
jgi:nucleotide-binding universal stress UspA family protein